MSQLEVLLLLQRDPGERWSADTVAARLHMPSEIAEATLSKYARAGIAAVEIDDAGKALFGYGPTSAALKRAVDELAAKYATHKTTVIALIFASPRDTIQDFADAFLLRTEDDG